MYSRAIKHASMCNQLIRSAEREEVLKILGRCYVTCCRQCSGPETGLRNTVRYKSYSPKGHQRLREHPVCIPIRGISSSPWHQVFAKDLFLGKFNKGRVMPFPKALDEDQSKLLGSLIDPVERYFLEKVDSSKIDEESKIPDEVMNGMKEMGLFGLQIPEEYGGLGLSNTSYARVVEAVCSDPAISTTLMAHQSIGLKGILIFGTNAQKEKYLPKLASGENIAAFALTEPSSGSDAASIQTRATLSQDGKHFLLNGSKIWISNGGWADVFTVFAQTEVVDDKGGKKDKITAFIVERAFGGLDSGKPEDKLGIRGSNTCEVYFDNTPVPVENVLGEVGGGFKVAMNILNSGRFGMAAGAAGGLRKLLSMAAEHATTREQFGHTLSEFGLIKEKFARMSLAAYAIESMAYMTSAMIDLGEADCSLEAAMCKVYGSEGVWSGVNEALQIMGGMGYMKSYPFERMLRDTRILLIYEGTNEILRMYIALTGMQHAGKELKKMMKSMINPLKAPGVVSDLVSKRLKNAFGIAKTDVTGVDEALKDCADKLGRNIAAFSITSDKLLQKFGKEIVHEQMLLKRMADVAIHLYAMTAVLSRATDSKKNGIETADDEILLARRFCNEAFEKNVLLLDQIKKGSTANGDEEIKIIADKIFKAGRQIVEHPLSV